ncbi:MAG: Lrp/AsnC family transcriptional regulator [Candidatus Omnitrophica bacterium]|nr:Lrp/AsnC family transcriptional regulator [Candidatus Omnitrophota bacterium]
MNRKQKLILKILKTLQSDFPLTKNPYQALADKLGMDETALIAEIKLLKRKGYVRRIGAVVSAARLGYKSTLVAARMEKAFMSRNIAFINTRENVTHNYLRGAKYNVWFTFSAKTKKEIEDFIRVFKKRRGVVDVLSLPAKRTFKINAEFRF